ncbi:hypothetical protein Bca101_075847 [Brassica carinata]
MGTLTGLQPRWPRFPLMPQVAQKKKKKKDGKKRSREETFMEPAGTSAAMGSDDMGRLDPIDSTRGSSEGCPKKKTRRTAAGDEGRCDGTPVPEGPSKSGGGSQDGSPSSKRAPSSAARGKDGESGGSLPQMSGRGFPDDPAGAEPACTTRGLR